MDFNEGDKVRISAYRVDEFAVVLKDSDIGENERECKKLALCEHVVYDTDPGADEDVCIGVNGVDGSEVWVNSSWLETSPFDPLTEPLKPGDKVMVAKTKSSLFGLPGTVKNVEGEGPKAMIDTAVQGREGRDDGFYRSNVLLLAQRDEDGFKVGDTVRVKEDALESLLSVSINEPSAKEMLGMVYEIVEHKQKCMGACGIYEGWRLNTSRLGTTAINYWVKADAIERVAAVVEAPKVVSTEAKSEVKKGDKVRILNTTRELQEIGYSIKHAMMMSRRVGQVADVSKDGTRAVVVADKGRIVCTKFEKLNP